MFKFLRRKSKSHATADAVREIFEQVLDIGRIDENANFFELGGDSMMATIVATSLEERGHTVPSTSVFDYPSIAALVAFIEDGGAPPSAGESRTIKLQPRNTNGPTRLRASLLQERLWPYERNPDPKRFQLRGEGAARLCGDLDIDALEQSLKSVAMRHEVLRSSFLEESEGVFVDVHPSANISLEKRDAVGVTVEDRRSHAAELTSEITSEVFELGQPPPMRCALLKINDDEHVLAVSTHHIISDGWSMGLFVNDLAATYNAIISNKAPELPALAYQFADYAAWHRTWLDSDAGTASKIFWRDYLKGLPPALEIPLPADQPRKSVFNFPVRRTAVEIPADVQAALKDVARAHKTSVHSVFLAVVLATLKKLSDVYNLPGYDIPVGIMHANRAAPGTQNLIGFFSTLVLLRFELSQQDPALSDLIKQVQVATRTVEPHVGVPIGALMDDGIVDTLPRIFVDSVPRPALPEMNGLTVEDFPFEPPPLFAVADIAVFLFERGESLSCMLGTNADMFSKIAAARLSEALKESLKSLKAA